jgi:hypothetical protein
VPLAAILRLQPNRSDFNPRQAGIHVLIVRHRCSEPRYAHQYRQVVAKRRGPDSSIAPKASISWQHPDGTGRVDDSVYNRILYRRNQTLKTSS